MPGGPKLLNEKDSSTGCTPLHMATQHGHLTCLDSLLALGANASEKNNDNESPLHFAARFEKKLSVKEDIKILDIRYGRIHTVRRLIWSRAGPNIINESDGNGLTALHIASANGHTKVVRALLHKGALLHKFVAFFGIFVQCYTFQRLFRSYSLASCRRERLHAHDETASVLSR